MIKIAGGRKERWSYEKGGIIIQRSKRGQSKRSGEKSLA